MIVRYLIFSFFVSLLSLLVVLFTPLEIPLREHEIIYSPYHEELEQLSAKEGFTPKENDYHLNLIEKNNWWFDEQRIEYIKNTASNPTAAWKKKSNRLILLIMIMWTVLFYFFHKRKCGKYAPVVLVFPIVLSVAQLMSVLEVVAISAIVLGVWFIVWPSTTNKNQ